MLARLALFVSCALLCGAGAWPRPAGGLSNSGAPEVLFSFDDGPHEEHTGDILDVLGDYGVHALFFWNGNRMQPKSRWYKKRVSLVNRAVTDGHLVGNHTMNHAKLCRLPPKEAAAEIDDNAALFAKITGLPMLLMRVPYGARCQQVEQMLSERKLHHFHWDADPQEFRNDERHTVSYVIRKLRNLKDGQRLVVLMHDTKRTTAKALPEILEWIKEENQRRRHLVGKREIRIVSGSEIVRDRMPMPLARWVQRGIQTWL